MLSSFGFVNKYEETLKNLALQNLFVDKIIIIK